MKLQLDTSAKTIKVDENVNLGDLVKHLDKLLPKDSPFGHWKEYEIQTNVVINNWSNPIIIDRWQPSYPNWITSPYTITSGYTSDGSQLLQEGVLTTEGTSTISYSTNAVYNIDLK